MRQWPQQKEMHRYPVSPTGVLQVFYDFFKFFCKVVPDRFLKNLFLFLFLQSCPRPIFEKFIFNYKVFPD